MPQSLECKLNVRRPQICILMPGVQFHRVVLRGTCISAEAAEQADVQFFGLPWLQTFFDLLRKSAGVGRSAKRLSGHNGRSLMVAVTVAVAVAVGLGVTLGERAFGRRP